MPQAGLVSHLLSQPRKAEALVKVLTVFRKENIDVRDRDTMDFE